MKATEKKTLDTIISNIEEMVSDATTLRDSLQEAYDGKSEKWQEGDKGQALYEAIGNLETAIDSLESAKGDFESAKESE